VTGNAVILYESTVTGGSVSSGTGTYNLIGSVVGGYTYGSTATNNAVILGGKMKFTNNKNIYGGYLVENKSGNAFTNNKLYLDAGTLSITTVSSADPNGSTVTGGSVTARNFEYLYFAGSGTVSGINLDTTPYQSNTGGVVKLDTSGYAAVFNGTISGNNGIEKTGAGTLTLNGNNTYGVGTTLTSGTIVVGHNSALGSATVTMAGGTTLGFSGNRSLANTFTLNNGVATFDTDRATPGR
jgi:autotransporter-associated beta strand protein